VPDRPEFHLVAGPSGSGKSDRFNVRDSGVDSFNVDDRCRELHGSYLQIPPAIRVQAQQECERFVDGHIAALRSFATETTLRTTVAIDQAKRARAAGFFTRMVFVATEDVALNIERVRLRGLAGGHAATAEKIQDTYVRSLANLPEALTVFDSVSIWDNSDAEPRHVLDVIQNRVKAAHFPLPTWLRVALAGSGIELPVEPS
jgi:predicted ABC-type ATPase